MLCRSRFERVRADNPYVVNCSPFMVSCSTYVGCSSLCVHSHTYNVGYCSGMSTKERF